MFSGLILVCSLMGAPPGDCTADNAVVKLNSSPGVFATKSECLESGMDAFHSLILPGLPQDKAPYGVTIECTEDQVVPTQPLPGSKKK